MEEADLTRCMRAKCQLSCNWPDGAPVLWRYSITFAVIRSITREIQFDVCWSAAVALKWHITHSSSSPANTCVRCDFRDMEMSMKIWSETSTTMIKAIVCVFGPWSEEELLQKSFHQLKSASNNQLSSLVLGVIWQYGHSAPFWEEIQTQTRNLKKANN